MIPTHDLALALFQAERQQSSIQPLSETYPSLTPTQAYAIQSALLALKQGAGVEAVGHKIGLTNKAMQQQLGVDQPDYGVLLNTMVVAPGSTLAASDFIQARIEPEIAFWLAEDVRGPGVTAEQVLAATRGVSASLELVDSRIANWRITLVDTIADNASSARMIVSKQVVPVAGLDLAQVETALTRNGEPVGRGMALLCWAIQP
jgi:2-keto-4-pentenoate hydratase